MAVIMKAGVNYELKRLANNYNARRKRLEKAIHAKGVALSADYCAKLSPLLADYDIKKKLTIRVNYSVRQRVHDDFFTKLKSIEDSNHTEWNRLTLVHFVKLKSLAYNYRAKQKALDDRTWVLPANCAESLTKGA